MALKRFASHTEDEIIKKRLTNVPVNTEKNNKKAAILLREYLTETEQSSNFEALSAQQLNDVRKHFYLSARKADGEMYKVNTLESTRYSLNRYLKSPPVQKTFDIIKDNEFNEANMCFKTAITELKANGKGTTEHHPIVSEEDHKKIYSSIHTSPNTPFGLYNKVQWDIRLYFFRRGAENMRSMTKNTFVVKIDPETNRKYVTKNIDELTKNHCADDKEKLTAMMPEQPDSPFCPVHSFEKYISKLHPICNNL
jgi:hypothetical protein